MPKRITRWLLLVFCADDVPTIYLLGDSTVADQPLEPYNSWGQMLPHFFKPGVAIANLSIAKYLVNHD